MLRLRRLLFVTLLVLPPRATALAVEPAAPLGATSLPPSPSPPAAIPMFSDSAAGVRFPVPFPEARFKSAGQIRELLLRRPGVRIPPAAQFTSGIYSTTTSGMPYVLVWKLKQPLGFNTNEMSKMAAAAALDGLNGHMDQFAVRDWTFHQDTLRGTGTADLVDGLKARLIVQVLRSSVVYVGYFYKDAADAAAFDPVIAGLTVLAGRARLAEPPKRVDVGPLALAVVAFVLAAGGLLGLRLRCRPPPPPA